MTKSESFSRERSKRKGIHARMSAPAQARNQDSLRNRLYASWCTKAEMISKIMKRMGCDEAQAESKFVTAKKAKVIVCDKPSGLWATADAAREFDPPKKAAERTPRQQEHWDRWSSAPDLANGPDPEQSELFKWAVAEGIATTVDDAAAKYHHARTGTRTDELKPTCYIKVDGVKVAHGKNYYRPGIARKLAQRTCNEMVEVFREHYHKGIGVSPAKLSGFEPDAIVRQAIWRGDLLMVNVREDPFNSGESFGACDLVGADELAFQDKKEAERKQAEEKERKATAEALSERKAKEEKEREERAQASNARRDAELAEKQRIKIERELEAKRQQKENEKREDIARRRLGLIDKRYDYMLGDFDWLHKAFTRRVGTIENFTKAVPNTDEIAGHRRFVIDELIRLGTLVETKEEHYEYRPQKVVGDAV